MVLEKERGETHTFRVEFRDADNALFDPASPTFKVCLGSELIVTCSGIKVATGTYLVDHDVSISAKLGEYHLEASGLLDGHPVLSRTPFKVIHTGRK